MMSILFENPWVHEYAICLSFGTPFADSGWHSNNAAEEEGKSEEAREEEVHSGQRSRLLPKECRRLRNAS